MVIVGSHKELKLKMKLKCDITVLIIIFVLSFLGGGVAGYFIAPKEINQYQYITQNQSQNQMQFQSQITIAGRHKVQTLQIEIEGMTNIIVTTITNGITNSVITNKE